MSKYRTAPVPTTKMPGGIPYIIGNEFAERFSFYGMKAILMVFMTKHLIDSNGELAVMSEEDATANVHFFMTAVYLTPLFGAFVADWLLGKYRTIISLSIVYCLGHLALAVDETRIGLAVGLVLIAVGAGGIKPCVSAHVGDQFGKSNENLIEKIFSWFYMSINLGAFLSMLATPVLLDQLGPHWAFGIPGILMALATIVFWMGRHKFVHIQPRGKEFIREAFSASGLKVMGKLIPLYAFVAMFWALFDQTASRWVTQAENMDRVLFGFKLLPSQLQAANPLMIVILVPVCTMYVYPWLDKLFNLTSLRKVAIGLFLTVVPFSIAALIQANIDAGGEPSILWQVLAYFFLTFAEIMISITCLEFSYTQAPKAMKSLIMGLYMASVSLGNLFTALVNVFIKRDDGTSLLEGASYYWFFTAAMFVTACFFLIFVKLYKPRTYIQDEEPHCEVVDEAISH